MLPLSPNQLAQIVLTECARVDARHPSSEPGDSAAEVFMALSRRLGKRTVPPKKTLNFVHCAARNEAHRYHVQEARRKSRDLDLLRNMAFRKPYHAEEGRRTSRVGPFAVVWDDPAAPNRECEVAAREAIAGLVRSLPERDRRIIAARLHFPDAPTVAELSREIGVTEQALYKRFKTLRRLLRRELPKDMIP